jgi:hypothetical protein
MYVCVKLPLLPPHSQWQGTDSGEKQPCDRTTTETSTSKTSKAVVRLQTQGIPSHIPPPPVLSRYAEVCSWSLEKRKGQAGCVWPNLELGGVTLWVGGGAGDRQSEARRGQVQVEVCPCPLKRIGVISQDVPPPLFLSHIAGLALSHRVG